MLLEFCMLHEQQRTLLLATAQHNQAGQHKWRHEMNCATHCISQSSKPPGPHHDRLADPFFLMGKFLLPCGYPRLPPLYEFMLFQSVSDEGKCMCGATVVLVMLRLHA